MTNTLVHKWNGFAVSIPGFGHIRTEIPCQDASAVITSPREALIVCDGRGSAKLSQLGAQGAVKMFATQIAILDPLIASILDTEEENLEKWNKFCQIMYRTLMQVKLDLAAQHGEEEKEFDFTVAFAITGTHHIGCFQVGDGAIVLRQNGDCVTAFEPDKGEFANQTHFLREGGEEKMKFHSALFDARKNSGIAATSDGPEFKMFHLPDMVPGKIFYHLFDDLMAEELDRSDVLTYLTRNDWNTDPRGSDDRSIALLVPQDLLQTSDIGTSAADEPALVPDGSVAGVPVITSEEAVAEAPTAEPEEAVAEAPTAEPEAAVAESPTAEPEEAVAEAPTAEPEEAVAETPTAEPEEAQKKRTVQIKSAVVHAALYGLLTGAIVTLLGIFQYQTSYIKSLEVRSHELEMQLESKHKTSEPRTEKVAVTTITINENEGDFK